MENNSNSSSNLLSNGSVTYSAHKAITESSDLVKEDHSSSASNENALLFSAGTSGAEYINLTKSGDGSGGEASTKYGNNAALLAYNGASVDFNNSSIETSAKYASALFSFGRPTVINAMNSRIRTYSDYSDALKVVDGGRIIAVNLDILTSGSHSSPICGDTGGGNIEVFKGSYSSTGANSPVIYAGNGTSVSTSEATLNAKVSEGVIINGGGSVALNDSILSATNSSLSDGANTSKTISIIQTGANTDGNTGVFSASNSVITTNRGDHFYVSNTNTTVNLSTTRFVMNDSNGIFMRAQAGNWGNSGSNGGHAVINATHQEIFGKLYADNISSITLNLYSQSYFKGALTGEGSKNLRISTDSTFILEEDTNLDDIDVIDSDTGDVIETDEGYYYSNIYANGHNLYANSSRLSINDGESPASNVVYSQKAQDLAVLAAHANEGQGGVPAGTIAGIAGSLVIVAAAIGIAIFFFLKKRKKDEEDKKSRAVK